MHACAHHGVPSLPTLRVQIALLLYRAGSPYTYRGHGAPPSLIDAAGASRGGAAGGGALHNGSSCAALTLSRSRHFTEPTPGAPVRDHFIMQAADGTYALRLGDWKLIERVGAPKFEPRPSTKTGKKTHVGPKHDELFNLRDDPSEMNDLSANHADQVANMKRFLAEARDRGFTRPDAN